MPPSAQALYFNLGMRADDDGFIFNPKDIAKRTGSSQSDLEILIHESFVITSNVSNGVYIVKEA